MTNNIRHCIENHTPVQLEPGTQEGLAKIRDTDLMELQTLAQQAIFVRSIPGQEGFLEAPVDELKALLVQAHHNVHGEAHQESEPDDEDLAQLRQAAMSYAFQLVACRIQSGVEASNSAVELDVVTQAEAIYGFLKGE